MKRFAATLSIISSLFIYSAGATDINPVYDNFYQSSLLTSEKVRFNNQYQIKVAGNLFIPKNLNADTKYPAIINLSKRLTPKRLSLKSFIG